MLAKHQARQQARAYLRQLDEQQKADYSRQILEQLKLQLDKLQLQRIGLYSALPDEPQLLPLIEQLHAADCRCYLPRCQPGYSLSWHLADADLQAQSYGILEPQADSPASAASELQLVIIPALAYNTRLQRLGRGAGYYDRLLAQLSPQCLLWGVIFSEAQQIEFAAEAHDLQLHQLFYARQQQSGR